MLDPRFGINLRTRRRCFRGLVKICGEHCILPSSYIIPESKVQKLGDCAVSSGGFSDVWPGMYEEDLAVAIKVIRYCELDDVQKVKKVRYPNLFPRTIGPDHPQNFCREVITWKRMSHPNILPLIGVMMNENEYSMVAPWMDNGNVIEFLKDPENHQANPLKLVCIVFHFIHLFVESGHS
jgi:hypothetical protein